MNAELPIDVRVLGNYNKKLSPPFLIFFNSIIAKYNLCSHFSFPEMVTLLADDGV